MATATAVAATAVAGYANGTPAVCPATAAVTTRGAGAAAVVAGNIHVRKPVATVRGGVTAAELIWMG